jgi:hypothetical protein
MVKIKLLSSIEHPESSICNAEALLKAWPTILGIQSAPRVRYVLA